MKNFELLKIKNRYVIFDKKTKAHYYGKKVDLEKKLKELNATTFNELKTFLSEQDIDQIIEIIGKGCRVKTCQRLRSILTYSPSLIPSYGIFERLIREDGQWSYIAGQSYPDEIRALKEIILKG